jgi:hypothetical protein
VAPDKGGEFPDDGIVAAILHDLDHASSAGFDPSSQMVAASLTSNSRALAMMKQTFSVEIDRIGASGPVGAGNGSLESPPSADVRSTEA